MVALAATDWTVTVDNRRILPKIRRHRVKLVIGDGAKTYSAGGIPAPTFTQLGMQRALEQLTLVDDSVADGRIYKWDKANNKIKIFSQGILTGATAAAAAGNGALITTSAAGGATESVVRASGTAASTSYDTGPLVEVPAALAPASFTLWAIAEGW